MICWPLWKNISIAADIFYYLDNSHFGLKSKLIVCLVLINPALKGGVNDALDNKGL